EQDLGGVDILINNAGKSIRRPLAESLDRWHDVERTMALNYYSPLRLIRGLAPGLIERGDGPIINGSPWGVLSESSPLFAVYNASKAALSVVSRVIETEWATKGVHSTTLYYPLVKTPMIEPTREYDGLPGLSAAEAADWMITAARTRPVRIAPRMAVTAHALNTIAPPAVAAIMKGQRVRPAARPPEKCAVTVLRPNPAADVIDTASWRSWPAGCSCGRSTIPARCGSTATSSAWRSPASTARARCFTPASR